MTEKDKELGPELMLSTLTSTNDALMASVESFRNRALSFATLVVTIAGALTAGFIFSDVGTGASFLVRILGVAGIVLLMVAFGFYVNAAQYVRNAAESSDLNDSGPEPANTEQHSGWQSLKSKLEEYHAEATAEIKTVKQRTKFGNWSGALSLVAVVASIICGVMQSPVQKFEIPVAQLPKDILRLCPQLEQMVEVSVEDTRLRDGGPLVPITFPGAECSNQLVGSIEVLIPKKDLVIWRPQSE